MPFMFHHDDIVEEIATKRHGKVDAVDRHIIKGQRCLRTGGACISSMGMSRYLNISSTKKISGWSNVLTCSQDKPLNERYGVSSIVAFRDL